MRQKLYLIIICILCFSFKAMAEPGSELTLSEALKIAYAYNPQMVQARGGVLAAQGAKITAGSWDNPQLEIEPDLIKLKQSLDPFGKAIKGKAAQKKILSQQERVKSIWGEVYIETRNVYSKIILDKKQVELQKNNLKAMRQFFSQVQMRYQSGKVFKNQMQRAKVELFRVQGEYLKADNELKIDQAKLNLLLGRPKETAFDIKEQMEVSDIKLNLEALSRLAIEQSPSIKQEKLELDAADLQVQQEQLNRLPDFSLGFQKSEVQEEDDVAAIFEVSIPLWNLNQGEIKKAQAERMAQESRVQEVLRQVDFDIYRIYCNAQVTKKQVDLYAQALHEANEMFVLAGLRYQEGEMSFIEYLDQLQASIATRTQYYQGLYALQNSVNALEGEIHASLRGEEFFHEIH